MDKESKAALMLHFHQGLSTADISKLYQVFGSLDVVVSSGSEQWPETLSKRAQQSLNHLLREKTGLEARAEDTLGWCQANGVHCLSIVDPLFPPLLKEIATPPILLFVRGDIELLSLPQIAIVGSRNASASGFNIASEFARVLAGSGFAITSGMALGIDGAAHIGALKMGKTVAVLGTGLDVVYPRQHHELYQQILDNSGVIISEFLPGTPPLPANFPRRNRVISGLSLGTMVVEAAIRSGSLITARYAMEQGREVFAVPGSIHNVLSKGSHHLLKQGATLVESAQDIVEQLGGMLAYTEMEFSKQKINGGKNGPLLEALGFDPVDIDTLVERTGLPIATLNHQLILLELEGAVESSNGRYHRLM
ncbi:MAG: DNA-processing protein DprA [Porticoccus sp.]